MTFIALKPGLLTLDGPDHCGELHVHDLGLDVEQLVAAQGHTIGSEILARCVPPRPANSHKGTFGSLGIVGGAPGMYGAALLAGRAALKLGAGRVYVGVLDASGQRVDPMQPELMLREADEVLAMQDLSCLVLGPGLSRSNRAKECVTRALSMDVPQVIDADALNLIGADPSLQEACRGRGAATLLTPHPAEAARLRQTITAEIQQDRVVAARTLAQQYRALVALKGAGTVIAAPDARFFINTSGNPGLASAGMGDVLSGILGALLAQGASAEIAMCAGVHLHGAAADALYQQHGGPIGMTGSEVTDAARGLLNRAIYADSARTV
jgi:ADP-dependent NAD(P)H-hydrate dehydratase / NAD(P)H-hydrate epimerase